MFAESKCQGVRELHKEFTINSDYLPIQGEWK